MGEQVDGKFREGGWSSETEERREGVGPHKQASWAEMETVATLDLLLNDTLYLATLQKKISSRFCRKDGHSWWETGWFKKPIKQNDTIILIKWIIVLKSLSVRILLLMWSIRYHINFIFYHFGSFSCDILRVLVTNITKLLCHLTVTFKCLSVSGR